jgi:hypothetical protein
MDMARRVSPPGNLESAWQTGYRAGGLRQKMSIDLVSAVLCRVRI